MRRAYCVAVPKCGWGQELMVQGALLGTSGGIPAPGPKEGLAGWQLPGLTTMGSTSTQARLGCRGDYFPF